MADDEAPARVDIDTAMVRLGLGRAEVYRKVKDGELKGEKVDHHLLLEAAGVEALADKLGGDRESLRAELDARLSQWAAGADPEAEAPAVDAAESDLLAEAGRRLLGLAVVTHGAEDLYIDPVGDGDRVLLSRGGVRQEQGRLSPAMSGRLKTWMQSQAPIAVGRDGVSQGVGWFTRGGLRRQLRLTVMPTVMGEHVHVRFFPADGDLASLGLEPAQVEALRASLIAGSGLVLLADAADAWSERLRHALVEACSADGRLVVSLEHRLQARHELLVQLDLAAEGRPPFAELFRGALAMDPDVVMVDEVRDGEQGRIVVDGAGGALVVAQVMAPDAAAAHRRLVGWEVAPETLASALSLTVERLHVRQLCPTCRREAPGDAAAGVARRFEAVGCEVCGGGYAGLRAVCGLEVAGEAEAAQAEGLSLRAALRRAVEAGDTPLAPVRRRLVAASPAAPTV